MKFVAFPEAEFTFSMRGPPPPQGQGNPVTGTLVDDFVNTKLNYFPKTLQLNHLSFSINRTDGGSYPHAIFGLSGLW